ncbi:MAG: hypothetical protein KIT22_14130, partial [Verrucomicrobiae bacterium]|nr:hypothetical protein [Verrucomicrobiae bacterium]
MNPSSFFSTARRLLPILAGWLLILGWLWRDSFRPGWLAFCNDAPYGLMAAFSEDRWDHLWHGSWSPLVWLGGPALPLQFSVTHGLYLLGGPVVFGKFAAPLSLLVLAIAGFALGRTLGFPRWVSFLLSLALGLNTNLLSHAAWGLGSRALAVAFALLAMAALYPAEPRRFWLRTLLAGGAVGLSVVEGADVGALLSLLVAGFLLMRGVLDRQFPLRTRLLRSAARLATVAAVAFLVASHAIAALVGTQIRGVAVLSDSQENREARWAYSAAWSFPKLEVLRFAIPGLMGYRPDTPNGGAYWGRLGVDGTPATRSNGGGEGMGALVLLLAGWAGWRAAVPGTKAVYSAEERAWIGFWVSVVGVALLLAFGRFAPFYRMFHSLPGAATMRMPMKFLHIVHLGGAILFGYGLAGLARRPRGTDSEGRKSGVRGTVADDHGVRQGWILAGTIAAIVAAAPFAESGLRHFIAEYLMGTGAASSDAGQAADFSVAEVRWSLLIAGLCVGALGVWRSFPREAVVRSMPWVLGGILIVDLGRSSTWFVVHYDAARRYGDNEVLRHLAETPWSGRVTARRFPDGRETLIPPDFGGWLYLQNQWMEEQFPYLRIQTLDIPQMPRMQALDAQFLDAMRPRTSQELWRIGRLWQLTNVRWIFAPSGAAGELNRVLDPLNRGFREAFSFGVAPRNTAGAPLRHPDDLTAVKASAGPLAVYSMDSSLPRVRWYSCWEVPEDEARLIGRLRDPAFDPAACVLLSRDAPAPAAPTTGQAEMTGAAQIVDWTPRRIRIRTDTSAPGVVLLNERWDPGWRVSVDGSPGTLLRANHLMRAVAVPSGAHAVEFAYAPPRHTHTLAISGGTLLTLLLLSMVSGRRAARKPADEPG